MEKLLEELSGRFGYAAPFIYAAAGYGLFHWLDENASDEAKAALARTMRFKDYKSEQVASALVEVFDRIYTYPLLRWRAFFRSVLFTTVVSTTFVFERYGYGVYQYLDRPLLISLLFNVLSDYLSLFVIRPLLIRSGTKPVIGLALGTVTGVAIVLVVNYLRRLYWNFVVDPLWLPLADYVDLAVPGWDGLLFVWLALVVFVWLPLFALGILIARFLTPLSWIVGRTQWFLKEGKEHPLKAIGYIAAVIVFFGTVAGRAVFST
jgi:hypothetical protein